MVRLSIVVGDRVRELRAQHGPDLCDGNAPRTLSPFQPSLPGVFAVGDVRSSSVKRVASAVGEGSVVVQAVHRYLAQTSR